MSLATLLTLLAACGQGISVRGIPFKCQKSTSLSCTFDQDAGIQHILTTGLATTINSSKTIRGWTVAIENVYADENRVVIGYTMRFPTPVAFTTVSSPHLEAYGLPLELHGEASGGMVAGLQGNVAWFDAAPMIRQFDAAPGSRQSLFADMHLTIPGIYIYPTPSGTSFPTPRPGVVLPTSPPVTAPPTDLSRVIGPFVFDLGVSINPTSRAADLNQTLKTDKGSATLESVLATPSETRVLLSGIQLEGGMIELAFDGWSSTGGFGELNCRPRKPDQTVCSIGASLMDKQGEWTLVAGDSWTFHFHMPAGTSEYWPRPIKAAPFRIDPSNWTSG